MIQSHPILYSFRRCPYAMRGRLALYQAKISHEHREVDLKNKPLEMLTRSPKGTVPVLQLADGNVLEESLDIMTRAFGNSSLSSEDTDLITENDTTFKHALDRYKYPGRYPEEGMINYRKECEKFLRKLEERLRPFLTGKTPTLVDMAIFPFIRQFSHVDPEWFSELLSPHLHFWLNYFETSDLFNDVMNKYEPWSPGDNPVLITF